MMGGPTSLSSWPAVMTLVVLYGFLKCRVFSQPDNPALVEVLKVFVVEYTEVFLDYGGAHVWPNFPGGDEFKKPGVWRSG